MIFRDRAHFTVALSLFLTGLALAFGLHGRAHVAVLTAACAVLCAVATPEHRR